MTKSFGTALKQHFNAINFMVMKVLWLRREKHMISLASVRDVKNFEGEVWYIVRSPGKLVFDEKHKHVPELSPSSRLFYAYLDAKKMGMFDNQRLTAHFHENPILIHFVLYFPHNVSHESQVRIICSDFYQSTGMSFCI